VEEKHSAMESVAKGVEALLRDRGGIAYWVWRGFDSGCRGKGKSECRSGGCSCAKCKVRPLAVVSRRHGGEKVRKHFPGH